MRLCGDTRPATGAREGQVAAPPGDLQCRQTVCGSTVDRLHPAVLSMPSGPSVWPSDAPSPAPSVPSVLNVSATEFMNSDSDQTRRILDKLARARAADPEHKVFGASAHRYVLRAPASPQAVTGFEERLGITLPEAFRRFLLEVGCGGDGYEGSAAGPFYGVFGLERGRQSESLEWLAKVVAKPCLLSPRMSATEWEALTTRLGIGGDASDDQFDQAQETLFAGLLPIGTQGCSMYHGLVVTGPHAGRVVNFDQECSGPPVFAFEPDFLAWYERWLDEVIDGDLVQKGPSWFGYTRGVILPPYDRTRTIRNVASSRPGPPAVDVAGIPWASASSSSSEGARC